MDKIKRILITPGEPAGIGPDVTVRIAQQEWSAELIAVADPDLLIDRAALLNLPLTLTEYDPLKPAQKHKPGSLKYIPIKMHHLAEAGKLNPANADYVIQTLKKAAELCIKKETDAVVTGPVHKSIINEAGIPFQGHTEFFADYCKVAHTVMLFVIDQLKVALVTTHLPLSDVPKTITKKRLRLTLSILQKGLIDLFHIATPRILVCGLNPHAGENGYLGREEIDIITPCLNELREENYHLIGPLPADTLFTPFHLQQADAVVSMYHDQALPLIKYIGFDRAVNVTLGLPFIRTSVDHGTAITIAGTNAVNPGSMAAAIQLAITLRKPF